MHRPAPSPRLERALGRAGLVLLLLLLSLGAPYVINYRSEGAVYWRFSPRYLYGVVIPLGILWLMLLCLSLARETGAALMRSGFARLGRRAAALVAVPALGGSLVYAFNISDEYVSVLMILVLPCALAMAWAMSVRSVNLVLACLPLMACGIVLFATDLPGLIAGAPLAVWGDASTFATMFPREEPFIGRGGRLRAGLDVRMRSPEYRSGARLITNAAGFRNDREFPSEPAEGELRVLSLGDSFSTGYCEDQSAFFGPLLERRLAGHRGVGTVAVMNAEVSDPAYGLYYLQRYGMSYHPALVLYGLSGNDLMQAEQFYGADRLFKLEGTGQIVANEAFNPSIDSAWERYRGVVYSERISNDFAAPPFFARMLAKLVRFHLLSALAGAARRENDRSVVMPSYAESYERADGHKRLIDGSANLGFVLRQQIEPVERMYAAGFDLLAAMDRTARGGGARFLLVIYPQRYQVQPQDWIALKRYWSLRDDDFDLTLPNRRLATFCARAGVACCDPLEPFRAGARRQSLFLPGGDMHFNRAGHETVAAAVEECIERL